LGTYRRSGWPGRGGKIIGEQPVPERLKHQLELPDADHAVADLGARVAEVVVQLLISLPLGAPVPARHNGAGLDGVALVGLLGADAVHLEVDVDVVGDGLLVGVLAHQVLVEEPERLFDGGGGQPGQVDVEVLQYRPPPPVDRPVALVHDDQIECLRRHLRVVADLDHLVGVVVPVVGGIIDIRARHRCAAKNGVQALHGGDDDFR